MSTFSHPMTTTNNSLNLSESDTSTSKLKVLLVDDNKVNQFLGKRILNSLGIDQVDLASSGTEALELLRNKTYHVLLTDVEMPGMNGYELSRQIRSETSISDGLTIIAVTANASDEDREQARAAGIDDYLTKPYSPQDLSEALSKHIAYGNDQTDIQDGLNTESTDGISKIYAMFNHHTPDVAFFLQMLSKQIPELMDEIQHGIEGITSLEAAFQAAHKLKSPVKIFAGESLAAKFSAFTESLRNPEECFEPMKDFLFFKEEFQPIIDSLQKEHDRISGNGIK